MLTGECASSSCKPLRISSITEKSQISKCCPYSTCVLCVPQGLHSPYSTCALCVPQGLYSLASMHVHKKKSPPPPPPHTQNAMHMYPPSMCLQGPGAWGQGPPSTRPTHSTPTAERTIMVKGNEVVDQVGSPDLIH